jgi:hypothetical protein
MQTRRTKRTVTFNRPFILDGFDAPQPAGAYMVEIEEEVLGTMTFSAYRHMSTTIELRQPGLREYFPVDPQELAEALARDGAPLLQDNLSVPAWRGMDWVRRNRARHNGIR